MEDGMQNEMDRISAISKAETTVDSESITTKSCTSASCVSSVTTGLKKKKWITILIAIALGLGGVIKCLEWVNKIPFLKDAIQKGYSIFTARQSQKVWNECKEAVVYLYDEAGEFKANGFLVTEGDTTYVYTARHPIIADFSKDKQSAAKAELRSDFRGFVGDPQRELPPLLEWEILDWKHSTIYPWHDVARCAVFTTNKVMSLSDKISRINVNKDDKINLLVFDGKTYVGPIEGTIDGKNNEEAFFSYTLSCDAEAGFSGGALCLSSGVVVGVHSGNEETDARKCYGYFIGQEIDPASRKRQWVKVPHRRLKSYREVFENVNRASRDTSSGNGFYFQPSNSSELRLAVRKGGRCAIVCNSPFRKLTPDEYRKASNEFKHAKADDDSNSFPEYQVELGVELLLGRNKRKDVKKAVEYFSKAAACDNVWGKLMLAQCKLLGLAPVPGDDLSAIRVLNDELSQGNADAACILAIYYADMVRTPLAIQLARTYFRIAAEDGIPMAQHRYGLFLLYGDGGMVDSEQGLYWLGTAADQDYTPALCDLAYCYEYGMGVASDLAQAQWLYIKAEESICDDYDGEILGRFFDSTCVDMNKALYWLYKSARAGNSDAQMHLGYIYGVDEFGLQCVDASDYWVLNAASNGNADAQFLVGINAYVGDADSGTGICNSFDKLYDMQCGLLSDTHMQSGKHEQNNLLSDRAKKGWAYLELQADAGNVIAQLSLAIAAFARNDGVECEKWARKAANNGSIDGKRWLAMCYKDGIGVEKDSMMAFPLYKQIAEDGDAIGQSILGDFYYNGMVVTQDFNTAVYWYRKSAEGGNAYGQFRLGLCYSLGVVVDKNEFDAFRLYKLSAEHGDLNGQVRLGDCYRFGIGVDKNGDEAFRWYKQSAEHDHPSGSARLGDCYRFGIGVDKNESEAFKWYKASATSGMPDAYGQSGLGDCYRFGIGVDENEHEAFNWYNVSAVQGDSRGQFRLGDCYLYGIGVEKNCIEAFEWYKSSAEQGDCNGQAALGECYRHGIGVNTNGAEAVKWFMAAATQDHPNGYAGLGECYLNGVCVPKDEVLAFERIRKSAERGLPYGIALLGDCYLRGAGVDKDVQKALELYRKSASSYGIKRLARCYARGIGVGRDSKAAFVLYMKAAELDDPDACFAVGWCYENGFGVEKNDEEAGAWYRKVGNRHLEITKDELDGFLESAN